MAGARAVVAGTDGRARPTASQGGARAWAAVRGAWAWSCTTTRAERTRSRAPWRPRRTRRASPPSSSSLPSSGLLLTFAFSVPPRCVFELRRRARKQRRRAPRAARGRARGEAHLGPHRRGAEPPARRGAQGSAARQDSVARCVYFPD